MEKDLYGYVMERLDSTTETYQQIADGSGVPRRTVEKVARKEVADPGVSTAQKLADYFRAQEAKAA